MAFYASKGWMVGRNPMKNWQAAVRTWERNTNGNHRQASKPGLFDGLKEFMADEQR